MLFIPRFLHGPCTRRAALALLVGATCLFAQQSVEMLGGRAVVANEIIIKLKASDTLALNRVRAASPLASFRGLGMNRGLHLIHSNSQNVSHS